MADVLLTIEQVAYYFNVFFTGKPSVHAFVQFDEIKRNLETYIQETNWNFDLKIKAEFLVDAIYKKGYYCTFFGGVFCCDVRIAEAKKLCDTNVVQYAESAKEILKKHADCAYKQISIYKASLVEIERTAECDRSVIIGDDGRIKIAIDLGNDNLIMGFEENKQLDRDVLVIRKFPQEKELSF